MACDGQAEAEHGLPQTKFSILRQAESRLKAISLHIGAPELPESTRCYRYWKLLRAGHGGGEDLEG